MQDISFKTLQNAVRVVFVERPGELIHARFLFRVGSNNEDDTNRGVSHLIEHLFFGASKSRSVRDFQLALRRLGAQVNASTGCQSTEYHFEAIQKNFGEAFNLYLDQLENFYLEESFLEKEKEVVCQEADMQEDEQHYVALYNLLGASFKGHPISIPVVGYKDVIRSLSVEDVMKYHDTYYVSGNLICILVGAFSEEAKAAICERLEDFTPGEMTGELVFTDAMMKPYQKVSKFFKEGLTQHVVKALLPVPQKNLPAQLIAATIMGQGLGSFLWEEFREKRSLSYLIAAANFEFDVDHFAMFFSTALSREEDIETAVNLFKDAVSYLRVAPRDKFEEAKALYKTDRLRDLQSLSSVASTIEDIIYEKLPLESSDIFVKMLDALTYEEFEDFAELLNANMQDFTYTVLSMEE